LNFIDVLTNFFNLLEELVHLSTVDVDRHGVISPHVVIITTRGRFKGR